MSDRPRRCAVTGGAVDGRRLPSDCDAGCVEPNAQRRQRALRGVALGRRNWTFAGSDEGGRRAAAVYSLVATCKLNDVDPRAWPAYVLAALPDHPITRINELMPWAWKARLEAAAQAATAAAA
jgi:transposase